MVPISCSAWQEHIQEQQKQPTDWSEILPSRPQKCLKTFPKGFVYAKNNSLLSKCCSRCQAWYQIPETRPKAEHKQLLCELELIWKVQPGLQSSGWDHNVNLATAWVSLKSGFLPQTPPEFAFSEWTSYSEQKPGGDLTCKQHNSAAASTWKIISIAM